MLLEHTDNTRVINALDEHRQQVIQQQWVLLQVECQRAIVNLNVGDLG